MNSSSYGNLWTQFKLITFQINVIRFILLRTSNIFRSSISYKFTKIQSEIGPRNVSQWNIYLNREHITDGIEFVEDLLEPKLVRLVRDNEEVFIVNTFTVLFTEKPLAGEDFVQLQVLAVQQAVGMVGHVQSILGVWCQPERKNVKSESWIHQTIHWRLRNFRKQRKFYPNPLFIGHPLIVDPAQLTWIENVQNKPKKKSKLRFSPGEMRVFQVNCTDWVQQLAENIDLDAAFIGHTAHLPHGSPRSVRPPLCRANFVRIDQLLTLHFSPFSPSFFFNF